MSTIATGRKPTLARIVVILALLLIFSSIAIPAGATPPEELNFTFTDVTYYDLPTDTGYGTWSAEGVIDGAGDTVEYPNHSGWDPDGCWRAVHITATLTDSVTSDTITIRTQVTKIEGAPNCFSFDARGNWVILSGTGAYADLHGQGNGTISGYLDVVDPINGIFNYVLTYDLEGQGHFD